MTPEDRFAKLGTPRPYCLNTGFSGVPNGPVHYSGITEYSDEGFIKRITHIDGKGRSDVSAESKDYPIDTAIITYGMNNPIDETRDYGDKASPDYQVQKYDLMGRQVELSFPNKGIRYESRFDAQGLEVEELSYKDNKLDSAKRFTYEMNSRGDWVKKHETFWSAKFSGLGYAPSENYYREITYYGE